MQGSGVRLMCVLPTDRPGGCLDTTNTAQRALTMDAEAARALSGGGGGGTTEDELRATPYPLPMPGLFGFDFVVDMSCKVRSAV